MSIEKRPIGLPQVLAVLLPILGCLALARMGANRPEKLILGKWRVAGSNATIEFKPDGTFLARNKTLSKGSRVKPATQFRSQGRYSLPDRTHLRLEPLRTEQGADLPGMAPIGSSSRVWLPANAVEIEREQVRIFAGESSRTVAQVWNRVE